VVNDAGLLVAPEDHAALSAALLRVLTEPALVSSLRQRGLARAAQFTWARTAAATAAVYDSVLR
jgi:glycosyltransferase involved in cell wall biosynthesis